MLLFVVVVVAVVVGVVFVNVVVVVVDCVVVVVAVVDVVVVDVAAVVVVDVVVVVVAFPQAYWKHKGFLPDSKDNWISECWIPCPSPKGKPNKYSDTDVSIRIFLYGYLHSFKLSV